MNSFRDVADTASHSLVTQHVTDPSSRIQHLHPKTWHGTYLSTIRHCNISLSCEPKPRITALQIICIWLIISNFIQCFICFTVIVIRAKTWEESLCYENEDSNGDCDLYSTCDYGQWNCTQKVCAKTCSVISLQRIKTFDGKEFDIRGPPSNLTLVEVRKFFVYFMVSWLNAYRNNKKHNFIKLFPNKKLINSFRDSELLAS